MSADALQDGDRPFREKLRELRRARGLSLEGLAYATRDADPAGKGLSFGGVGHLERGVHQPKLETVELIAAALDVAPETFAEYRLAKVREQFDERQVGLERALENLSEFESSRWEALAESSRDADKLRQDPAASPSKSAKGEADRARPPRARRRASARRGRA